MPKQFYIATCPRSGSTATANYFNLGHECYNDRGMVSGLHFYDLKPDAILIRNPYDTINSLKEWIGNPGWWNHYASWFLDLYHDPYKPPWFNAALFWIYCYEKLILFDCPVLVLENAPFFKPVKNRIDYDWEVKLPDKIKDNLDSIFSDYLLRGQSWQSLKI